MTIEIKTIEEFLSVIFEAQKEMDDYNKGNETYIGHKGLAFRGQGNEAHELLPSIGRGRRNACSISILDQVRNLIEMAKYKLPHIFKSDLLPIDLLALLQHYGIPTRLMDVTYNPLVALYFASSDVKENGEVIVFEYLDGDKTNYPVVNAIADSYRFSRGTNYQLSLFYKNVFMQSYFDEQRSQLSCRKNEDGGTWIKECCNDLLFVNATEQLERQRLQQGFYILFPNKISVHDDVLYFDKVISPIDKNHKQIKARIIINKNAKSDIRRKLALLGISEETLFADNVDIVCKNIVSQCREYKI